MFCSSCGKEVKEGNQYLSSLVDNSTKLTDIIIYERH